MYIQECHSDEEINSTFAVMSQLRTSLQPDSYLLLVQSLEKTEGYKLVAVFSDDDVCISVAGYQLTRSLFNNGQSEMYVADFVTDKFQQGKGVGKFLFGFLKQKCRELKCPTLVLDSGNQRVDAHGFYRAQGMQEALHFYLKV